MFSAGAHGWGEAFVTAYPESDKVGAEPGVMFRRADAIDSWLGEEGEAPATLGDECSAPEPVHLAYLCNAGFGFCVSGDAPFR